MEINFSTWENRQEGRKIAAIWQAEVETSKKKTNRVRSAFPGWGYQLVAKPREQEKRMNEVAWELTFLPLQAFCGSVSASENVFLPVDSTLLKLETYGWIFRLRNGLISIVLINLVGRACSWNIELRRKCEIEVRAPSGIRTQRPFKFTLEGQIDDYYLLPYIGSCTPTDDTREIFIWGSTQRNIG